MYAMRFAGEVELLAFLSVRLEDDFAVLIVERKPRDVERAVSHGQLIVAIPHARTVGVDLHVRLATARRLLLGAAWRKTTSNRRETAPIVYRSPGPDLAGGGPGAQLTWGH